jgi:hypothetical protein
MTPIVCLTGTHNLGISFLDWSLHWLSGQQQVYHWQQGWVPLAANPLTAVNSHGHTRNHVDGLEQTQIMLQQLQRVPAQFHTAYPTPPRPDFRAQQLGLDHTVMQDSDQWQQLVNQCQLEYADLWQWCYQDGCARVLVATDVDNQVYHAQARNRAQHSAVFVDQPVDHTFLHMHHLFFKDSLAHTHDIWDQREILALNLQWNQDRMGHEYLNFSHPHTWINCRELWYHGCELLPQLMHALGIDLVQQRWHDWQQVYHQWQKINYQCLQFQYRLPHIVKATAEAWYFAIPNLTLLQEVMILHELMYKYSLNVKNWQLEYFPDNTQKLHQLLEPLQHTLRRSTQ